MESIAPHAFCPRYLHAVELIGSRWMGAVIRALLHDIERFNDLKHAIPGVSSRMLTERLRELEHEGIVERHVDQGPPTRVSYRLTPKGRALGAVVEGITAWAHAWEPEQRQEQSAVTDRGAKA